MIAIRQSINLSIRGSRPVCAQCPVMTHVDVVGIHRELQNMEHSAVTHVLLNLPLPFLHLRFHRKSQASREDTSDDRTLRFRHRERNDFLIEDRERQTWMTLIEDMLINVLGPLAVEIAGAIEYGIDIFLDAAVLKTNTAARCQEFCDRRLIDFRFRRIIREVRFGLG
ncbi:hypothetical protein KC336_g4 [Hortaea werneckii]|nr:hypothetical protein KC336_g4 [Hortaea werneckii]